MELRPNIVWLFSDQHRADVLGAAGHPVVQTPRLDALAASGTVFSQTYCQGPICVPARTSLLTERYVRDHGVFENDYEGPQLPTIVDNIRSVGYETVGIGKMHLFPHSGDSTGRASRFRELGFETVEDEPGKLVAGLLPSGYSRYLQELGLADRYRQFVLERSNMFRMAGIDTSLPMKPHWTVDPVPFSAEHHIDTYVGRKAVAWIRNRRASRPFFLWVGFPGPHDPWDAPTDFVQMYREADIDLDSTKRPDLPASGPLRTFLATFLDYSDSARLTDERVRDVRRHYFANVTMIDEAIGQIVDALVEQDVIDNTWIIYSSDHGEMLGTHGLLSKMVFYEPSVRVPLIVTPPGGLSSRVISGITEHVDLSATLCDIAGASRVPFAAGRSLLDSLQMRGWSPRECAVSEAYGFGMWRTERYKIVVYEREHLPVQLFDLEEDPQEDTNLVADSRYRKVIEGLLDAFVKPFLSVPPNRPGPDLIERGGTIGSEFSSLSHD